MRLFIDDLRPIPLGFTIARSSEEAKTIVGEFGIPSFISFDHDLGGQDTSMVFIKWMIEGILDGDLELPKNFGFAVHSANPVGKENIESLLNNFLTNYRKNDKLD